MRPGDYLRRLRTRLNITTREVEEISRTIAEGEHNEEFFVSHARIIQVENDESTPSIYKLYTLSAIYGTKLTDLLAHYVDLEGLSRYQMDIKLDNTRLMEFEVHNTERAVRFPVRFDPGFRTDKTNLLSRMVEIWGEVPVALIQGFDLRKGLYGYIGLEDFTLYPLLRPGSFVQIDDRQRKVQRETYQCEFERPIYFIELREGYICSWCELHGDRLLAVPHPLSPCQVHEFAFPTDAEIVGRVTAVAARIVNFNDHAGAPAKSPAQL